MQQHWLPELGTFWLKPITDLKSQISTVDRVKTTSAKCVKQTQFLIRTFTSIPGKKKKSLYTDIILSHFFTLTEECFQILPVRLESDSFFTSTNTGRAISQKWWGCWRKAVLLLGRGRWCPILVLMGNGEGWVIWLYRAAGLRDAQHVTQPLCVCCLGSYHAGRKQGALIDQARYSVSVIF